MHSGKVQVKPDLNEPCGLIKNLIYSDDFRILVGIDVELSLVFLSIMRLFEVN